MNTFVVDASAWVEYFDGSPLGEKVKTYIENDGNQIYTNVFTLAELSSHFTKRGVDFSQARKIILSLSLIFPVDVHFAEEAGKAHAELRKERKSMSLADVFVLLTAKKVSGKLITKDEDFNGLPEAIFLRNHKA